MTKYLFLIITAFMVSCTSGPKFYSESSLAQMANREFTQLKQELPISQNADYNRRVQEVGRRIAQTVGNRMPNAQWEFVVFQNDTPNAFAMPGGKIGFFTGILDLMDSDDEIAAVMGHEVAHVLLQHSNQRMSAEVIRGVVGIGAAIGTRNMDEGDRNMVLAAYGLGTQVGIMLPYSRSHESEADREGILLAAQAGYDPRAAITFWQKMSRAGGGQTPEFLSTHPSHGTRIQNLNTWIPEAMAIYQRNQRN